MAIENSVDIADDAERTTATFDSVLAKLQQLIDSQTQLLASISQRVDSADKEDESDGYTMDVELF